MGCSLLAPDAALAASRGLQPTPHRRTEGNSDTGPPESARLHGSRFSSTTCRRHRAAVTLAWHPTRGHERNSDQRLHGSAHAGATSDAKPSSTKDAAPAFRTTLAL